MHICILYVMLIPLVPLASTSYRTVILPNSPLLRLISNSTVKSIYYMQKDSYLFVLVADLFVILLLQMTLTQN